MLNLKSIPTLLSGFALLILLTFATPIAGNTQESTSMPTDGSATILCSGYPTKPTPDNTGPYDESILTIYDGEREIETDHVVIENKIINGRLKINGANHVTVRNSIINGQGAFYALEITGGSTDFLIENVEVTNAKSAIVYIPGGSGGTLRKLHLHESAGDAMKTTGAENVLVESSYFAPTIGSADGAHADGNQTRAGGNEMTFLGNNIDMPVAEKGGPGAPYKSNANFIIQADVGNISNFLIACNWLNGGNYTVYLSQDKNNRGFLNLNPKLLHNKFGRDYRYGVLSFDRDILNSEICGNIWEDTGTLMAINRSTNCLRDLATPTVTPTPTATQSGTTTTPPTATPTSTPAPTTGVTKDELFLPFVIRR